MARDKLAEESDHIGGVVTDYSCWGNEIFSFHYKIGVYTWHTCFALNSLSGDSIRYNIHKQRS